MRVRKGDYSPILPSRIDHLAQKSAAQEVDLSRSENKIILATLSASLGRVGPNTAFVSPFPKRERALPTIGNKRGLTENKKFSHDKRVRCRTPALHRRVLFNYRSLGAGSLNVLLSDEKFCVEY
jgi:hypothetical protein